MTNSFYWKITRPLRFLKRFSQNPKRASYDLAKYFFLKLPPFARRKLEPLAIAIAQKLKGFQPVNTIGTPSNSLVKDIVWNFGVSQEFVRLYVQGQISFDWSLSNWQEFLDTLSPTSRMYVTFAMTTVGRGRDIFSLLESHSCVRKKNRYLDVGTGYGGFLRAFKESGFKEVIGIELQPRLVSLAQANIVGLQGAQVLKGDFVKEDFSSLGTFDIITCNDVIEHVDDPVLTIQKLSALINDDGCISFEVPNKDCIAFVKSDGHFQIFGITQLLKDDAADYYAACLGNKKSGYYFEMGEMYELEWYIEKLAENGLSAFMADTHVDGKIEDVPILIADLKQAYRTWQAEKQPNLELGIAQKVASAVEKYMRELELAFTALTDDTSKQRFIDKYLRSFWTIIASRNLPQ